MTETFERVDRNIYKMGRGCFRVSITRRALDKYIVQSFDTIGSARKFRDQQEAALPGHKPWGIRKPEGFYRAAYMSALRAERKAAGLCLWCGDATGDGYATCADCRNVRRIKRQIKMEEA